MFTSVGGATLKYRDFGLPPPLPLPTPPGLRLPSPPHPRPLPKSHLSFAQFGGFGEGSPAKDGRDA